MHTAFDPPLIFARLSGLPSSCIDSISSEMLRVSEEGIAGLDAAITSARDAMSTALHRLVGSIDAKPLRNRLLEVRRDLYNGRLPSVSRLDAVYLLMDDGTRRIVVHYHDLLLARHAALENFRRQYASESCETRTRFQQMVGDEDFMKGVLLSSPTLFRNISRYRQADPSAVGSRDEQIERGLLRYFARASMKATPFARFCSIVPAEFGGDEAVIDGDPIAKRGAVRLDKGWFRVFWLRLRRRTAVRHALRVELNPTLEVEGDRLRFLASIEGAEFFQRVKSGEALGVVIRAARETGGVTLGELIDRVVAEPELEASTEEATQYIESLVAMGLLRFRPIVPEQVVDWDVPLREFLAGVADQHAQTVANALAELRELIDEFTDTGVARRAVLLQQMQAAIDVVIQTLGITGAVPRNRIVFEDATASCTVRLPWSNEMRETLASLDELARLMRPAAATRSLQMEARHFFDTRHPQEERLPLLHFYEDFYRNHFKDHSEKETRWMAGDIDDELRNYDVGNPFRLNEVKALRMASGLLSDAVRRLWEADQAARELCVEDATFGVLSSAPQTCEPFRSLGVFCQIIQDERTGKVRCVLGGPSFHGGFGKFFSRFLYLLPDDVRRQIVATNESFTNDLIAEICGDANFNANLHPPLLPFEISHPSGESGSDAVRLAASDLDVDRDPVDRFALRLIHRPSGRRVYPVDLGFLNPNMRPPLFKLLTRFAPAPTAVFVLPPTPHATERPTGQLPAGQHTTGAQPIAAPPTIVRRPRLVFRQRVVIARERWTVPGQLHPRARSGESSADLFLRVNQWRRENGLPEEVYVRVLVAPHRGATAARGKVPADAEAGADDGTEHDLEAADNEPADDEAAGGDAEETIHAEPEQPVGDATPKRAIGRIDLHRSRDHRKPQYIHFSSPLLVSLFARLAVGLEGFYTVIEECYPTRAQLLTAQGGRPFTMELVVQLDVKAADASSFEPEFATERGPIAMSSDG